MKKRLVYNDDGWSSYMRYPAPMSVEQIRAVTVAPVAGTDVTHYQFCALGGHAVNYRSAFLPRVGETMERVDSLHVYRMLETLRHLDELGTDPLRVVTDACHEHGIACSFSLRMNDRHHTYRRSDGSWYFPELLSPWLDSHPELLLTDRALDYAHPEVAEYRTRQIREVLERYEVDGIDLDFTRFRPWFAPGAERDGAPMMTALVRELAETTARSAKALSARFEYDPEVCVASGLDIETWLDEGLFEQITLGGVGDHTPDAPCDFWVERTRRSGCLVCPGIEGQLHWVPGCGGGGTGTRPGRGVHDGFGPPSIEYLRAVAANHYASGADGLSLFNFTCADGPFDREALTTLARPEGLEQKDKRYVVSPWPADAQIYYDQWRSRFSLPPSGDRIDFAFRIADDVPDAIRRNLAPTALLTIDLKGVNRISDIEVSMNGVALARDDYHYNHYDHGYWTDIVHYPVPADAFRLGAQSFLLRRVRPTPGFEGDIEIRKFVLDLVYPGSFAPGEV